jgi:hypothetical protein
MPVGARVETRRPSPGELARAALIHFIAPRFAIQCGSS